jgi:hypothetical protein
VPGPEQPARLTLRAYNVGFGDCFLLSFHYPSLKRHILIDFGSSGVGADGGVALLRRIALDIRAVTGGKLHAVVATHRHRDHINGFATSKSGNGPGDIIRALKPDVVVQPWTEDPDAAFDAPKASRLESERRAFVASLAGMQAFCAHLLRRLPALGEKISRSGLRQLQFLGETNLQNRAAVQNLQTMGRRNFYVNFGSRSGLEAVLPGVHVHVLGPPTLEQSTAIRRQRAKDAAEYWHLLGRAERNRVYAGGRLFPDSPVYRRAFLPPDSRWFITKVQRLQTEEWLGIVRALDAAMNNTSVILLFECGSKKLLFPGDAQMENWSYALSKPGIRKLLEDVNLYKVGHHGSLNATPKSLWNLFRLRSERPTIERLKTVNSTLPGIHGDARNGTEVPRKKLVEALKRESEYITTEDIKGKTSLSLELEIDL